jgi:hypothetical protein
LRRRHRSLGPRRARPDVRLEDDSHTRRRLAGAAETNLAVHPRGKLKAVDDRLPRLQGLSVPVDRLVPDPRIAEGFGDEGLDGEGLAALWSPTELPLTPGRRAGRAPRRRTCFAVLSHHRTFQLIGSPPVCWRLDSFQFRRSEPRPRRSPGIGAASLVGPFPPPGHPFFGAIPSGPAGQTRLAGKCPSGHVKWRMANTSEASSREQRSYSLALL